MGVGTGSDCGGGTGERGLLCLGLAGSGAPSVMTSTSNRSGWSVLFWESHRPPRLRPSTSHHHSRRQIRLVRVSKPLLLLACDPDLVASPGWTDALSRRGPSADDRAA